MTFWHFAEFSFHFYVNFHGIENQSQRFDRQIVIMDIDSENLFRSIEEHVGIVIIDFQCDGADNVLINANAKLMDHIWIVWNVPSSEESEKNVWPIFENITILPKSEIFYITNSVASNNLIIQQVYKIGLETSLMVEQFGEITGQGYFIDHRHTSITSRRRQNLLGLHLKACMVVTNNDTLNHLTDYQ